MVNKELASGGGVAFVRMVEDSLWGAGAGFERLRREAGASRTHWLKWARAVAEVRGLLRERFKFPEGRPAKSRNGGARRATWRELRNMPGAGRVDTWRKVVGAAVLSSPRRGAASAALSVTVAHGQLVGFRALAGDLTTDHEACARYVRFWCRALNVRQARAGGGERASLGFSHVQRRGTVQRADVAPLRLAPLPIWSGRALSVTVTAGQAVGFGVSPADARATYVVWWEVGAPDRMVTDYLTTASRSAGRAASGRVGRVSATSRQEAVADARAAIITASAVRLSPSPCCHCRSLVGLPATRRFSPRALLSAARRPDSLRAVKFAGKTHSAAMRGLRGGLAVGVTGASDAMRGVRVDGSATLATLADALGAGDGWRPDLVEDYATQAAESAARRWSDALTLARACRRLETAHLNRLAASHADRWKSPGAASARAWGRTASAARLRFARVRAVLVWIALGQSLAWACEVGHKRQLRPGHKLPASRAGFAFDWSDGRSKAFADAFADLGLRAALCTRQTRGSVRPSASLPTVTV